MSELTFTADIDLKLLERKIGQIDSNLSKLAQQAANSGSVLDRSFQQAGKSAGALGTDLGTLQRNLLGLASVATLGRLGQQIITIRGEFQQLGIAFETMLGSKEKADKLMAQAVDFASKTPFTLTDVASNIKQLLAMGIAEKDVMTTLKALGDVSAGVSVDLSRVALNYGQVATTGKLMGKEMRDFMVSGIPLSAELAKNLGVTKTQIDDMVTAGKIGFADVQKAFMTMSGEGGMFFNLMEKQSLSVTGQISNLTDQIDKMFNDIGKSNEGLIYGGIAGLSAVVSNYESILKVLEVLVVTYGTYRAALMLSTVAQTLSTTAGVYDIATKNLAIGATLRAAAAQSTLNAVIMANPYVAAAAGIAALVSILFIFSDKAKTTEDYIKDLNDSMSQIGKQIEIEETVQKFTELDSKVVKTKDEQAEYNKTLQKLATIFPEAIGQTDQYGKAVDLVKDKLIAQNKELRDNLVLVSEKKAQESQKELNKLLADQARLQKEINTGKSTVTRQYGIAGSIELPVTFTSEEIAKKREELASLAVSIAQFGSTVEKENADILKLKTIDANETLRPYKNLFADVTTLSKQAAINARSELLKISTPEGSVASQMVKEQIDAIDQYLLKLKTTGAQVKQWQTELAAAKEKLKQINDENYNSLDPAKDKADQEEIIKTLSEKLGLKKAEKKAVDELKKAEEELEAAVKNGDQTAANAAAERITALEKEKKLIQDKIELEMQQAWRRQFDGQSMTQMSPIGVKPVYQVGQQTTIQGVRYEVTAIDKTGPVWKKAKAEIGELKKFEKKQNEDGAKDQQKLDEDDAKRKKENYENLIGYSRQFTSELITQAGLSEEQAKTLNSMADTFANLAKGDYLAAAFSSASMLLSLLSSSKNPDANTLALERMNNLLKQQSAILSNLAGSNYFQLAKKQYEDLGKLIEADTELLRNTKILNITGVSSYYKDFNTDQFIKAFSNGVLLLNDAQTKIITDIIEARKQQQDLLQETFRQTLGFDASEVSDSIFQGIEDGLKLGKDSLGGFAQSFGELMKKALMQGIMESMKIELTAGFLTKYKQFISAESEGKEKLTPTEISLLEKDYADAISQGKAAIDALQPILNKYGLDLAQKNNSLTGQIAGASEETVSLVAGQMMAIRVDIKANQNIMQNQLELMDLGLSYLHTIANNTKDIKTNTARLESIESGITQMNDTLNKKL